LRATQTRGVEPGQRGLVRVSGGHVPGVRGAVQGRVRRQRPAARGAPVGGRHATTRGRAAAVGPLVCYDGGEVLGGGQTRDDTRLGQVDDAGEQLADLEPAVRAEVVEDRLSVGGDLGGGGAGGHVCHFPHVASPLLYLPSVPVGVDS